MKLTSLSVAIGLATGLFHVLPVHAQQADNAPVATDTAKPKNAKQLDTVVVTARKREETLQDVPIAVSAFTAQSLERQNVQSLSDLQGKVPSLQIYAARG